MNTINYNGKTYRHEKYNRILDLGDGTFGMTDAPEFITDAQVRDDMNASFATSYSYMYCGDKGLEPFEAKEEEDEEEQDQE